MRALFVAGGGSESELEPLWQLEQSFQRKVLEDLEGQRYSAAGGTVHYLVSGRRRA